MFISASNFSIAPTGASTLDRFFSTPAAAPAPAVATTAPTHPAAPAGGSNPQQPQQQLVPPLPLQQQPAAAAAGQAGVKREAVGAAGHGRVSKAARFHTQPGDLRLLLAAAAPSAAATPAAVAAATPGPVQAAAAAAATQQEGRSAAERDAAAGSDLTGDLGWAFAWGADSDVSSAGEAGGLDTGRSEGEGEDEGTIVISDSQGPLGDADADSNAHTADLFSSFGAGSTAQTAVAARPGAFSAPTAVPGHLKHVSPARSALSALQALQPFSTSAAAGGVTLPGSAAADCQAAGQGSGTAPDSTQPSQVLPPSLHAWLGGTQQQQQAGSQQGEGECAAERVRADGQQDAAAPAAACGDPGSSSTQQQEEQPGSGREQGQGELVAWQPAQPRAGGGALLPGQPLQLADLDPEVMAALPWDIQLEVQQQLRAGARRGLAGSTQASRRGARGSGGRRGQQQQQQQGTIHRFLKK